MGFFSALGGLFGGGGPKVQGTPPYVPAGKTTGVPGGAAQSGGGLSQALPAILGAGASIGGTVLQQRAANHGNDILRQRAEMQDKLSREEMARREYYASILLPSLLQALGNRNPQVAQSALGRQQSSIAGVPNAGGLPGAGPGQSTAPPSSQYSAVQGGGAPPFVSDPSNPMERFLTPTGLDGEAAWRRLLRV